MQEQALRCGRTHASDGAHEHERPPQIALRNKQAKELADCAMELSESCFQQGA